MFINPAIKRCEGCKKKFRNSQRIAPHDMVFRFHTYRTYFDEKKKKTVQKHYKERSYFHMKDMGCLRVSAQFLEKNHIYMNNDTYKELTPAHKKILKSKGYRDYILINRKAAKEMCK